MKKWMIVFALLSLLLAWADSSMAQGIPWRNHAYPYNFLFGNHIDTHQQTGLLKDGTLQGYFYITFTGEFTPDGLPVARHCDASTPPDRCLAGWTLRGKPGSATFVFHEMDHPLWLVDSRADIPQPGAFAHFHWLGMPEMPEGLVMGAKFEGYFLELYAIKSFAFMHDGQLIPVKPGIDIATPVNIVSSFPPACMGACGAGN